MKIQRKMMLAVSLIFMGLTVFSQEEESLEDLFKVDYDTPLTLDLEENEEVDLVKKKKRKKRNFFFGLKTRKAFTRVTRGNKVTIALFHVLKKYQPPPAYAADFYWYDYKKKKITNSLKVKGGHKNVGVLHGPYVKKIGDQVIEQGLYYKGMKHKRWVRYNSKDILQHKSYWWKGWTQESRLVYYDFEKTKLREVIPVHYGEKDGEYWAFHKDGSLAVRGQYKFDHKVALWREYYDGERTKREVIYPDDPFDFKATPYITREWDSKGRLIYDHLKVLKKKN